MASVEVIASGGILFILYYFLIRTIGATELGIWSLILATSSAARLSELGLSGGVVRFVAKYIAQGDTRNASAVVQTAAISIAGLMAIFVIAIYPILVSLIYYFLPAENHSAGLALVPFALLSLWLGSLSGIFTSALDGVFRTDVRSLIMMGGAALHLTLVVILTPKFGLLGLAYAQVIQLAVVLFLSWSILRRYLVSLPTVPRQWSRSLFGEMFKYGLNFQVGTIAQVLFDPTTKMLMSKFGGLDLVAYYEMSSRMVQQFRNLVVSANRVLVPVFAGLFEATPERISDLYRKSYDVLLFVALPIFSGTIAMVPAISEIWIGTYQPSFASFTVILTMAWFLNTLNSPSYFANLGTGHLNWNTIAHVVIGVLNAALGIALGLAFGGIGVVVGSSIALIFGSILIIVSYHTKNNVPYSQLVPRKHLLIAIASLFVPVFTWQMYDVLHKGFTALGIAATCFVFVIGIFLPIAWIHPLRFQLLKRVLG